MILLTNEQAQALAYVVNQAGKVADARGRLSLHPAAEASNKARECAEFARLLHALETGGQAAGAWLNQALSR